MEARDAADPDEYFYMNEAFHEQIYAGSHNTFLAEQARSLQCRHRPRSGTWAEGIYGIDAKRNILRSQAAAPAIFGRKYTAPCIL